MKTPLNLNKAKSVFRLGKPNIKPMVHFASGAVNLMAGTASYKKMVGFDVYNNMPFWETQYYANDEYATAINTISQFIGASGWNWVGESDDQTRAWRDWKKAVDLDTQMDQLTKTMLGLGNSQAIIAQGIPELGQPPVIMQIVHPIQVYPVFHESGAIQAWDIYADIYKTGAILDQVHIMDMLHFTNAMFGKNKLGLAMGQQLYTRLKRKRQVELICSLISQNMSAPLKHIKADLEGLDKTIPEGEEGPSEAQKRINDVTETFTRRVNPEKEFIWDVVVTDQSVEAQVLEAKIDLSSVTEFLKHDQVLIDSALMVPPVFKGKPDNSNRASSYNELIGFAIYLKQLWNRITLQMNQKLVPQVLNDPNPKGAFAYEAIIKEDEIRKLETAIKAFQVGMVDRWEAMKYAGIEEQATSLE